MFSGNWHKFAVVLNASTVALRASHSVHDMVILIAHEWRHVWVPALPCTQLATELAVCWTGSGQGPAWPEMPLLLLFSLTSKPVLEVVGIELL